jgi:hypothetical protein
MRPFTPLLAFPLLALGLLACATPSSQSPDQWTLNKENKLVAAGFKQRAIKTEAQLTDFQQYPPHMIRPTTYKGRSVYVYADPTICGCLYMGSPTAYDTYIKGAEGRSMRGAYQSSQTTAGYTPMQVLDGSPWDDGELAIFVTN